MLDWVHSQVVRLRESLWFIPALMAAGGVVLAFALVWVDEQVSQEALASFPRLFGASASSSRSMLAAIGGSMITVAGVTFSITVVAVAQASSQYTSRVLRNFMSDRSNQVVLGVFVGVFTYCLVVLRTIRGGDEEAFIPAVSVVVGILLALAAIAFLIFFIHHIAESLQVETLLSRILRDSVRAVDRLFPDEVGRETELLPPLPAAGPWYCIPAAATGYIQSVAADRLLDLADAAGGVVRMERGVGEFMVEGTPLLSIASERAPDADAVKQAQSLFRILPHRTVHQDVEFGIRQMVDIGVKALSPGVNDVTTAVSCIDYISAVLCRLASRRIAFPVRADGGRPRLIARGPAFEGLVDTAFEELRRGAGGNVSILGRLLTALERVEPFTREPARRRHLRVHLDRVARAVAEAVHEPEPLAELQRRSDALAGRLDEAAAAGPPPSR